MSQFKPGQRKAIGRVLNNHVELHNDFIKIADDQLRKTKKDEAFKILKRDLEAVYPADKHDTPELYKQSLEEKLDEMYRNQCGITGGSNSLWEWFFDSDHGN